MSRLVWDSLSERRYEVGVDRGVLYPTVGPGVPWNGLTNVNKSSSGGDFSEYHLDGIKYYQDLSNSDLSIRIEAYTYPDEFEECQGDVYDDSGLGLGLQGSKSFGFSYRTLIGDGVENLDKGYKIHLVYNAMAKPSDRSYSTISDSPDAMTFSWDVSTVPVEIPGHRHTADVFINSTKIDAEMLSEIEDILYGTGSTSPRLPYPTELIDRYGTSLLMINENVATGVSAMTKSDTPDVVGKIRLGIFSETNPTRLKETNTPGLYDLE